jgi:hypothetical protein
MISRVRRKVKNLQPHPDLITGNMAALSCVTIRAWHSTKVPSLRLTNMPREVAPVIPKGVAIGLGRCGNWSGQRQDPWKYIDANTPHRKFRQVLRPESHSFLRGPSASEHRRTFVPAPARVSALSHMGFSHRRSVLRPLFRTLHSLLGYQRSSTLFDLSVCLQPPIRLPALLFPASPTSCR